MQLKIYYGNKWLSWNLYKVKVSGNNRDGWNFNSLTLINKDILIENKKPTYNEIIKLLTNYKLLKNLKENNILIEYDNADNLITIFHKNNYKPFAILERY